MGHNYVGHNYIGRRRWADQLNRSGDYAKLNGFVFGFRGVPASTGAPTVAVLSIARGPPPTTFDGATELTNIP